MAISMRCSSRLRALAGAVALLAAAGASAQGLTLAQQRDDLAQFRSEFLARDRSYSAAARAEAERRVAALEGRAEVLGAIPWSLALAQIAALADNGHTQVSASPRVSRSNRVPFRLAPFGEQFVVVRAQPAHADLLGLRLVAIDGVPLARLRQAAHGLAGGLPAWRDRTAPFLFESPEQLQALGLISDAGAAEYHFERDDGSTVQRRLTGEAPNPQRPRAETHRLLLPEVTGADLGWASPLPLDRAPWALRDAMQPLRWRHDEALKALVIDLRQTHDSRNQRLADFFAQVQQAIAQHRPEHLVLDLRGNGGGDLTRGRDFAASLPSRVPGRVFVLTSPATFSAAISLAGYTKQAAPERVVIVGEAIGDRLVFFAEGRFVRLQHSGEGVLPATERHDYADGCTRFDDCHRPVQERPIRVPSLAPDIAAPWTYAAWVAGRDPALEAVAAAVRLPR